MCVCVCVVDMLTDDEGFSAECDTTPPSVWCVVLTLMFLFRVVCSVRLCLCGVCCECVCVCVCACEAAVRLALCLCVFFVYGFCVFVCVVCVC